MVTKRTRPIVLVFSGHDPSGGAGLHADIESLSQFDCQVVSVITLLTVQDSCQVFSVEVPPLSQFKQATKILLENYPISAIKIGALADPNQVDFITQILSDYPQVSIVLDPVLSPTRGTNFSLPDVVDKLRNKLLDKIMLCTPNLNEVLELTQASSVEAAGAQMIKLGCQNCLVTSATITDDEKTHLLFQNGIATAKRYTSKSYDGEYHGSGCTLASAITAGLALGSPLEMAIADAIEYVSQTLMQADYVKDNIFIPKRYIK